MVADELCLAAAVAANFQLCIVESGLVPIHVDEEEIAAFVQEIDLERSTLLLDKCGGFHELKGYANSVLFLFDFDKH